MRTFNQQANPALSCRQCQTDIPPEVALTPEGAELIDFYCGTDCYQSFVAKTRTDSITDAMILAAPLV